MSVPRFPGKLRSAPLRPQRRAGMRRDTPGCAECTAGLPRQRSPPAHAPRIIIIVMIFIIYDFYKYSCRWPRLTRSAHTSILSAIHRDGKTFSAGGIFDAKVPIPPLSLPSFPAAAVAASRVPRPRPAASSRSALAAAAAASAGWGEQLPTPTAPDYQFPATAADLRSESKEISED